MDTTRSSTNVRVVPDLDDELLLALSRLEALLLSLAVWTTDDDVELPPPFAEQRALDALQAVADVIRPTQGRGGQEPVSGRLPREGWTGRLLPLRFVPVPDGPLATLGHAVQILSVQRAHASLNAAVDQYTDAVGEPPLAVVSSLSRAVGLITMPWDDDVRVLWHAATAYPAKCDTELSRSEQQAYDRVVLRIDRLWSYRPGVSERRP